MSTTSTELDVPQQSTAIAIRPGQQVWSEEQQAALAAMGVKNASQGDMAVFMHYCQRTGLDPFSKQIYMIHRREKVREYRQGRWVEDWIDKQVIQIGIEGFRVIRDRAARREGVDVEYRDTVWYDATGKPHDVWLWAEPPAACKFTVLKNGKPFSGALTFVEYVQTNSDGKPTGKWRDAPAHQLEKCAEAFALRRAFPHDLGGILLEDEAAAAVQDLAEAQNGSSRRTNGRVTSAEVLDRRPADPETHSIPHDDDLPAEQRPGSATNAQLTKLHTIFSKLSFGTPDRDQKLSIAEAITGRELTGPAKGRTSTNLSMTEARLLIDTLDSFEGRDALIAFMASRDLAVDGQGGEDEPDVPDVPDVPDDPGEQDDGERDAG